MKDNLKRKKIGNMELENINGGNTCHSSWTFQRLGIQPSARHGQRNDYHPVITTAINSCRFHAKGDLKSWSCTACDYHKCKGPIIYCKARSEECDPTE